MTTHDQSPGTPARPTQDECWENFWREIGQIAYRIWLDDHPSSPSGSVPESERLVEDTL